jgi:hypothetical protein
MTQVYLDILILVCLGLLVWGVVRSERAYQYPFIAGFMFCSFLLPQAYALVQNPGVAPQIAVTKVLVASCLCASACWWGYQIKPQRQVILALNIRLDDHRLFQAGLVCMLIGNFANFMLNRISIQTAENGNWTGIATIYFFFLQTAFIAFTIFLIKSLKKISYANLVCLIISGSPLIQMVLGGRRQPTMTLAIVIGLSVFLVHRMIPPRWFFVLFVVSTLFLIPLFGAVRGEIWTMLFSADWAALGTAIQGSFSGLLEGDILELRNAALLIDAADRTNTFGLGRGYWDALIFQFIPGQWLSFEFKQSLMFHADKFDLVDLYNYSTHTGTTTTGIGDSYVEFSYFGCLIFAIIAYIFKHLWIASVYYKSMPSQLLYIGLISPSMVAITHGVARFLQEFVFQLICISLIVLYSRQKTELQRSPYSSSLPY